MYLCEDGVNKRFTRASMVNKADKKHFKGTVSVVSTDLLFKERHPQFTTVSLNLR